jgi:hypothetical protein
VPLVPAVDVDPRRWMPGSVRYARGLLYLQASIWGLLCVLGILSATSPSPVFGPALMLVATGVAGSVAAAKTWLGHRIPRGSDNTRHGVIVVESLMACLGALLTLPVAIPEGGGVPALACVVGGGMSLAAAIGLAQPPARQYFAPAGSEIAEANPASRPDGGGSAPFWRLPTLLGVPQVVRYHPRHERNRAAVRCLSLQP